MLCNNATREGENEIATKWKIALSGSSQSFPTNSHRQPLASAISESNIIIRLKLQKGSFITVTTRVSLNILRKFVCKIFETDVFDVFEVDMTRKA